MSNFEGATLVPWQVCKEAISSFIDDKKWADGLIHSFYIYSLELDETEREMHKLFSNHGKQSASLTFAGILKGFEETNKFDNILNNLDAFRQVVDLTNNGKRDAYLNPEQAAFVNRWAR